MAGTTLERGTAADIFERLGIGDIAEGACGKQWIPCSGPELASISPRDERLLGRVKTATAAEYEQVVAESREVFTRWRLCPAPVRGQIVRAIGEELRKHKDSLGALVTLEAGKIRAEGNGEVQEMIDIADLAGACDA